MIRLADLRPVRRRIEIAILSLLGVASTALAIAPESPRAETPYEPNDTILSATGPLLASQTYFATLETPSDRDFFYFYATSPRGSQVELTAQNLGGGRVSDLSVTIKDSVAAPLAAQGFIREGEERAIAITLEPQKYFVEVATGEGFGDTYRLSPGTGSGAFEPYTRIGEQCANAAAAVAAAQTRLNRAKAKLQRALARLRRSGYGGPIARRRARAAYRKARARVMDGRGALKEAGESREPWCSIAQ